MAAQESSSADVVPISAVGEGGALPDVLRAMQHVWSKDKAADTTPQHRNARLLLDDDVKGFFARLVDLEKQFAPAAEPEGPSGPMTPPKPGEVCPLCQFETGIMDPVGLSNRELIDQLLAQEGEGATMGARLADVWVSLSLDEKAQVKRIARMPEEVKS